jgi:hypothetical protein
VIRRKSARMLGPDFAFDVPDQLFWTYGSHVGLDVIVFLFCRASKGNPQLGGATRGATGWSNAWSNGVEQRGHPASEARRRAKGTISFRRTTRQAVPSPSGTSARSPGNRRVPTLRRLAAGRHARPVAPGVFRQAPPAPCPSRNVSSTPCDSEPGVAGPRRSWVTPGMSRKIKEMRPNPLVNIVHIVNNVHSSVGS